MTMQKGDFPMNAVTVKNLTKVFRQGDEDTEICFPCTKGEA